MTIAYHANIVCQMIEYQNFDMMSVNLVSVMLTLSF